MECAWISRLVPEFIIYDVDVWYKIRRHSSFFCNKEIWDFRDGNGVHHTKSVGEGLPKYATTKSTN